jgi:hypothetical protein
VVTDHPDSSNSQVGVVVAEPVGLDVRNVEHIRQSRLSRWQRLP